MLVLRQVSPKRGLNIPTGQCKRLCVSQSHADIRSTQVTGKQLFYKLHHPSLEHWQGFFCCLFFLKTKKEPCNPEHFQSPSCGWKVQPRRAQLAEISPQRMVWLWCMKREIMRLNKKSAQPLNPEIISLAVYTVPSVQGAKLPRAPKKFTDPGLFVHWHRARFLRPRNRKESEEIPAP